MAATEVETLRAFRAGLYACLGRRRDALFELLDALLTTRPAPSLPHLSLAPGHRRGWGSVYAALRRGHVHVEALRALLLRQPLPDGPPLYAVAPALGAPLVLFDAGYDASGFTHALAGTPIALLIRLRSNRCFWFAPERAARPRGGRPRQHGATFVCNNPATWPLPTAALQATDEVSGHVAVRAWAGLHTSVRRPVRPGVVGQERGPRQLAYGTVVRLAVGRLPGRRRTPDVVWLWWQPAPSPGAPCESPLPSPDDLDRLWRGYCRRADLEQTFRFLKQALRWVTPRVRLPEQADRWTWLVLAASTQLRLARGAVADHRLPWERPLPPAGLTPARVHRGFATLARWLPPLASAPKPCGRSPGRPKGRRSAPAARYPPRKKAA
jgi:hypothetical protein